MKQILLPLLAVFSIYNIQAQRRIPAIQNTNIQRNPNAAIIEINKTGEPEAIYTPKQLVENVLFSSCVNLSNFNAVVSGTPTDNTTKSYGFFKKTVGSTFPFDSGIVLTNGVAYKGGNTIGAAPNDIISMMGDTDLETALGVTNTHDATYFEFDFVPTSNQLSFNFLMASSEYHGNWPCSFADGFAFLLKPIGGTYTNLAIIPGTTTPIACTTIHPATQDNGSTLPCNAANTTYFEGYDIGDTNYKGRTKVFTATSTVISGQTYHIKMIVADQNDRIYDTAVFLEAGSFNIGSVAIEDINGVLGTNQDLCSSDAFTQLFINNTTGATYQWQLFNSTTNAFEDIAGATNSTYAPTQDGHYKVIIIFGAGCTTEDELIITHHQTPVATQANCLAYCDNNNDGIWEHINLTSQDPIILNGQNPALFEIRYFASIADYTAGTVIATPTDYINTSAYTQTIIAEIRNINNNNCLDTTAFELSVYDNPIPLYRECDDDNDDLFLFDTSVLENTLLGGQTNVTVSYFEADGITPLTDANGVAITSPFPNTFLYGNIGNNGIAKDIIAVVTDTTGTQSCNPLQYPISFIVDDSPVANPVTIAPLCDLNENGIQIFNTNTLETTLLGSQTGMTVTYFENDGVTPLTDANGTTITSPFPVTFETTNKDIIAIVANPINTTCNAQTTITFIVNPVPQFDVTTPQFVCLNLLPITLIAENPNSTTYNYEWVKDGNIVGNLIDLTVNNGGTYTVTATNTTTGCAKTKTIFVDESSIASFGTDDVIITDAVDNNMVNIITANQNLGVGDYQFSMDNGVYQDEPLFEHVHAGIHTVTVDDKKTCGTVTITIAVVGFPKYVTPNADGYNDFWQAIGLDFQPNSMIYIYDRYGKLIHTQRSTDAGWSGIYNGFEADSGDYWYSAVLEDGRTIYGHFTLKR